MSIKKLLLWEKYRPKNIDDVIIPQRIKDQFSNGINKNYIFTGHYGTGKTSLARILIGKYTKDKNFLEINSSLYTSIDVLRTEIDNFCKTQSIIDSDDTNKYIFLDEFERVSTNYQDAFKAFVEKYHKNVRFILTSNHLNKISEGIRSRFLILDFDCRDQTEEKLLKQQIYKKIVNVISPAENINITKDQLVYLINSRFPDIRSILIELQNFKDSGHLSVSNSQISNKLKLELYQILYDKNLSYDSIYHFLQSNFTQDGVENIFKLLGKTFVDWSLEEKKENIDKLFELNFIFTDLYSKLENSLDPIILAMTLIGKYRNILIER